MNIVAEPTLEKGRNFMPKSKSAPIDYTDIPELDEKFWQEAKLVLPEKKTPISIRLDRDVLEWFKSQGEGYQSRINAVLRAYMRSRR